jgi:hypothetical protein
LLSAPSVSKQDALDIAQTFIDAIGAGIDLRHCAIHSIDFSSRNADTLYLLERFGYPEVKRLIQEKGCVYSYWVLQGQDAEKGIVRVSVDSRQGTVVGFELTGHAWGSRENVSLDKITALKVSSEFIAAQGSDIQQFHLQPQPDIKDPGQPHVTSFCWVSSLPMINETYAALFLKVKEGVVSFSKGIILPQRFKDRCHKDILFSQAWFFAALSLSFILTIIMVVEAFLKRKQLDWKLGKVYAIVMGLFFLVTKFTEESMFSASADMIFKLISVAMFSLAVMVIVSLTRQCFRESFGRDIFNPQKAPVDVRVIIGYSFAFISFIAVLGFYSILEYFHLVWDVGIDEIMGSIFTSKNMYWAPLAMAVLPAVTEEFFRGFTIAFCKKKFKSSLLAVVVAAFVWGFLHTSTDGSIYPGVFTGVEKFFTGIAAGYLLLWAGIEVAILWHFVNNFLATDLFLSLPGLGLCRYALTALVLALIPFVVAIYSYYKPPGKKALL